MSYRLIPAWFDAEFNIFRMQGQLQTQSTGPPPPHLCTSAAPRALRLFLPPPLRPSDLALSPGWSAGSDHGQRPHDPPNPQAQPSMRKERHYRQHGHRNRPPGADAVRRLDAIAVHRIRNSAGGPERRLQQWHHHPEEVEAERDARKRADGLRVHRGAVAQPAAETHGSAGALRRGLREDDVHSWEYVQFIPIIVSIPSVSCFPLIPLLFIGLNPTIGWFLSNFRWFIIGADHQIDNQQSQLGPQPIITKRVSQEIAQFLMSYGTVHNLQS